LLKHRILERKGETFSAAVKIQAAAFRIHIGAAPSWACENQYLLRSRKMIYMNGVD
jgi:hypothetical protein